MKEMEEEMQSYIEPLKANASQYEYGGWVYEWNANYMTQLLQNLTSHVEILQAFVH